MPGGNFRDESLEARIERIRERDEEIEKKHREAEADRLAALQANAMVKTTAPKEEDWPKAHKYDKLDFTYDVKTDDVDETNKKASSVLQRNYKKFPEGQGPPADPTYNFLADAERDGTAKNGANNGETEKKDWRANCTGGQLNRRGNNNNNNSFNKGRNNGKGKNQTTSGKFQQRNTGADGEYNSWKNERERIDESRLNRQKSDEGKWRREWDSEKHAQDNNQSNANADNAAPKVANAFVNNIRSLAAESVPNDVNNAAATIDLPKMCNRLPQKFNELNIEKRGNITVSISQDGEVKSVKLESTRAIGTGRVGNGMTLRQNSQPQYSAESNSGFDAAVAAGRRYDQTQMKNTAYLPQSTAVNAIQTNNVKRKSVQDRLTRNRTYFDESATNSNQ